MSQLGQFKSLNAAIETLTGDFGGVITPVGRNINILGGTNTITTGTPGTITIDVTGGMAWTEVVGAAQAMAVENGYITSNAGLVTCTLPAVAPVGSVVEVVGKGAGGWLIAQNIGQTIHFCAIDTTTGAGGSLASTVRYDAVSLVCITANTNWVVKTSVGNITIL